MLFRKTAHIPLLLGLMFTYSILPASAVPTLSIAPSSQVVEPGQSFLLNVDIANVTDLFSFQFDVAFNSSVLSAISITEGPFLPNNGTTFFIPGTLDNAGGTITATGDSLIGAIAGVSGNGTLATVSFQALALGTSLITLSNVILLDSNLGAITASTTDGTLIVTSIPEPSTLLLLATGLVGLLAGQWWRQQRTVRKPGLENQGRARITNRPLPC